jgi:hypothetical protein
MSMKRADLQRLVDTHRSYSAMLQDHLARLWQRSLTEQESNTVQNATLCCSFMSLESSERTLSLATSSEKATEEFLFLQSEVLANTDFVVQAVEHRPLGQQGLASHTAFPNLLAWEEALLASMA